MVSSISKILFSNGINEKIYVEIFSLFYNICKHSDLVESIEEKSLIDILVNELMYIHSFYLDYNNKAFLTILEILTFMSKEKKLKNQIMDSGVILKISFILRDYLDNLNVNVDFNKIEINEIFLESFLSILINLLKSKDIGKLLYDNYFSVLELIKAISLKFILPKSAITKLITVCQYIIDIENVFTRLNETDEDSNIHSTLLISQTYLGSLCDKLSYIDDQLIEKTLKKCIESIDRSENDNNSRTRSSTFSPALSELFYGKITSFYSIINKLSDEKFVIIINEIPVKFEMTCQTLIFILDSLNESEILLNKNERDNEQFLVNITIFSKLLELINAMLKSNKHAKLIENQKDFTFYIHKIYDQGIIDKILIYLKFSKNSQKNLIDECYKFILKLEEYDNERFYKTECIKDYFVCNHKFILQELEKNLSLSNTSKTDNNQNNTFSITYKLFTISSNFIELINIDLSNVFDKLKFFDVINVNVKNFSANEIGIIEEILSKSFKFLTHIKSSQLYKTKYELNSNNQSFHKNFETIFGVSIEELSLLLINLLKFQNLFQNEIKNMKNSIILIINEFHEYDLFCKKIIEEGLLDCLTNLIKLYLSHISEEITYNTSFNLFYCLKIAENYSKYNFFIIKLMDQVVLENLCNCINTLQLFIENDIDFDKYKLIDKSSSIINDDFGYENVLVSSINLIFKIFTKAAKSDKKLCTIMSIYEVKNTTVSLINSLLNFNKSKLEKYEKYINFQDIRDYILLNIELFLIITSDDYDINISKDIAILKQILDFLKINIKYKDLTQMTLKVTNFLISSYLKLNDDNSSKQLKKSYTEPVNVNQIKDISMIVDPYIMIEIINDLLDFYSNNYEITYLTCDLISEFLNLNEDSNVKEFVISIIVNNFDKYSSKQDIIEMFLKGILQMVKKDFKKTKSRSSIIINYDPSSIVYYMSKIYNSNLNKLNDNVLSYIFRIMRQVTKYPNLKTSLINEMFSISKCIENHNNLQKDDEFVLLFSKLFRIVSQNQQVKDRVSTILSNEFVDLINNSCNYIIFLLSKFNKFIENSNVDTELISIQILDDLKSIIVLYSIGSFDNIKLEVISDEILLAFNKIIGDKKLSYHKIFTILLEVINFMCIQSDEIKSKLVANEIPKHLEAFISKNQDNLDPLFDYNSKAVLISMKKKKKEMGDSIISKNTYHSRVSQMHNIGINNIKDYGNSNVKLTELKSENISFLTEEKKVKL